SVYADVLVEAWSERQRGKAVQIENCKMKTANCSVDDPGPFLRRSAEPFLACADLAPDLECADLATTQSHGDLETSMVCAEPATPIVSGAVAPTRSSIWNLLF